MSRKFSLSASSAHSGRWQTEITDDLNGESNVTELLADWPLWAVQRIAAGITKLVGLDVSAHDHLAAEVDESRQHTTNRGGGGL